MRLQDKIAIVTGAGHGMGESTARLFAREGAKVISVDIADEDGQRVAGEIRAAGGDAHFVHADVSLEADWAALVRSTIERHGRLDILVNNAGLSGAVADLESLAHF